MQPRQNECMQAMRVAGTTNGPSHRWHLRHEFIHSMDDAWAGVMFFLLLLLLLPSSMDDDDDDGGDIFRNNATHEDNYI